MQKNANETAKETKNMFLQSAKELKAVTTLAACAMFAALAMILNQVASIDIGPYVRIGFSGGAADESPFGFDAFKITFLLQALQRLTDRTAGNGILRGQLEFCRQFFPRRIFPCGNTLFQLIEYLVAFHWFLSAKNRYVQYMFIS